MMTASGFAGLGYQIVWTQQASLWLGHEAAAVLAIVTAFFGGLAVGALVLGPRIARSSSRPERWYAACEVTIALWSLLLALMMGPIGSRLLELTGAQPSPAWQLTVAFFGTFLVLLPATAAMGATLPAMERVLVRTGWQRRSIAVLYASNTLGAVLGVLATAFWLVPAVGLTRTAGICAMLNLFCALAAWRFAAGPGPNQVRQQPVRPQAGSLLAVLMATGLLGIGYEVLAVRVISQVTENTVYTFAILLAVYLVGTAIGAAAYHRRVGADGNFADIRGVPERTRRDRLLLLQAGACLLGAASLWAALDIRDAAGRLLGGGMGGALATEASLAFTAFALPTVVMGALFSHLSTQAREAGISFGRSLGVNTLGAAAAPILFGILIVPWLGAKAALLMVAAGYWALASRRAWVTPAALATAAVGLGWAYWAPALIFVDVPEGGKIVSYEEGAMAAVSVVQDVHGVSRLRIDNRQQEGSSSSLLVDGRQALLPLLLHAEPRRALFLGLGTGMTASTALLDPMLHIDVAELLPEVISASKHFIPATRAGSLDPRLNIVAADARRFVKAGRSGYDVIVSDNFHPARSGSGALYTVEHFRFVRAQLNEGGLFCQWLPLHQLDLETLRSVVKTFMAVYPGGFAVLASNSLETPVLGLVARVGAGPGAEPDRGQLDLGALRERLAGGIVRQRLVEFAIDDDFALLGGIVAGSKSLVRFAETASLNTDDRPVVAYKAPRITYAPDSRPADRLLELLGELEVEPGEVINGRDPAWLGRIAAYWKARDQFLQAGRDVRPSPDPRHMLAQVQEPLLSVLHMSPDFRPAYDPLLRLAKALARTDVAGARSLLTELVRTQPERPEAAEVLRLLADITPRTRGPS